jgi:hypothetical protein
LVVLEKVPWKKAALCLPGVFLILAALSTKPASVDDFRAFYRAATAIHSTAGVYSNPGSGPASFLPFLRFPSYAWMLQPFRTLTYQNAHSLWVALLIMALASFLFIARRRRTELALAICYSFPVAFSLVLGQDIAFVILIAMAVVRLYAEQKIPAAGLAASLLFVKATYLFPVALVFCAKSRRGSLSLLAGVLFQLALCFAVAGPQWPFEYLAVLRNPLLDREPRRMLSVRALLAPVPHSGAIFAILAALVFACLWLAARRLRFEDAITLALPLGLIASAHGYVYDAVVLIPLFVSVASLRTWTGRLALFGLTPAPYLLLLGDAPVKVWAGAGTVVAGVVFAALQICRDRAEAAPAWSLKLTPDSVPRVSPAT